MLYTRQQLRNLNEQESTVAIQRYFHKIHQGEGHRLYPHECDYISLRLRSIFKYIDGKPTFEMALDPYEQPFLAEAVFKYLILVYFENLDFLRPAFNGSGEMTQAEIERDRQHFEKLLSEWRVRLHGRKSNGLLHLIKEEYLRKAAIIDGLRQRNAFGWFVYQRKLLEQELMAFYTYFTVKMFFRNLKQEYVEYKRGDDRFIVNCYSYVHIVSRHYIAKFNGIDTERTFNSSLPFINPFEIPASIVALLADYFASAPAGYVLNPEYMIFRFRGDHYIIWWKRKKIQEIGNQEGFEVRTLYQMQSATDRARIGSKIIVAKNDELDFYY